MDRDEIAEAAKGEKIVASEEIFVLTRCEAESLGLFAGGEDGGLDEFGGVFGVVEANEA